MLLVFAPYGKLTPVLKQLENLPRKKRPFFVYWFFENPPDLRLPWFYVKTLSNWRSAIGRLNESKSKLLLWLIQHPPLRWIDQRMNKYRFIGDQFYAHQHDLLDLFATPSKIYQEYFTQRGLPAEFIPWGLSPQWYASLNIPRDIDVLWFGTRRTKQRSQLLDHVARGLQKISIKVHIADNIQNPFIYDEERTMILNRSKITLNLLPTWWDNCFPFRYNLAAGNHSMVISEPFLPHFPTYQDEVHYVSAKPEKLVDTIIHYLDHENERNRITEKAYHLVSTQLTLKNSIQLLMNKAEKAFRNR
jgi:hypothetical protein